MAFLIILIVVAAIATVFLSFRAKAGAFLSGICLITASVLLAGYGCDAKINKALMQSHLESPTNYTYVQLAEHNELVTKCKVWQGTIFSFYNDVDLQTIDIDNVSQKVIVK